MSVQSQANQYFNLHLEGFANLYDARVVKGKGFEYLAVRAAFLQGKADDAEPFFVDLRVTGKEALKVVSKFADQISSKEHKVSGVLKVGDLRVDAKEGKVFIAARLLTIKYLKIDGQKINLEEFENAPKPQQPTESIPAARVPAENPDEVRLDKNHPEFEARKAQLKAAGYRWNGERQAWIAPVKAA